MKKRIIIGLGIFVGLALLFIAILSVKQEVQLKTDGNGLIEFSYPALFSVKAESVEKIEIENSYDEVHHVEITLFDFHVGTYELVERHLGNGTTFLFERITNDTWFPLPIKTVLQLGTPIVTTNSWNPQEIKHPHHPDFGVDPTVNPWGVVTTETKQMLKSNMYLSKKLTTDYGENQTSFVRELDKEIRETTAKNKSIQQSAWIFPKHIAESWTLVSEKDLFTSEDAENEWIDYSLKNQSSQLNWLTVDGPYTKLPYSIEPGTKMGYGRAMGRFEDDIALTWYEKDGSLFHESMALNSRVNLLSYLKEYEGTRWPTEYTSMWLKNAYGLQAPYVDTRFNEYIAFYLDKMTVIFDEEISKESNYVPLYADYLLSRVEHGDIIKAGDGFLIVDYFDDREETDITHASLNHELGGLKILLDAYDTSGDEKYLNVANKIVKGIESFGRNDGGWIRENGDLWYQAKPDGTFSGDDYPQLTLVDLLETQALLEKLDMPRNVYFDKMIDSKMDYLKQEDIELIEKVTNLLK